MTENITTEYKSLRKVLTNNEKLDDFGLKNLAITCVCLANRQGGSIVIGIEDKDKLPPIGQKISDDLVNDTVTRLRSLCFNVGLTASTIEQHTNGSQYFKIIIYPSLKTISTTADGKVYIRVGNQCQPVRGEEILRLASEKDNFHWELQQRNIVFEQITSTNIELFAKEIRQSKRVKESVKTLTDREISEHYYLIENNQLTNLGVLWLGSPLQRSKLLYPINVQYIVYDGLENKIQKIDWQDNLYNPKELLLDIEKQATELSYFDEFPQGLFRKQIKHYDPRVVRELIVNAIAHKSYTISSDIFIKVYNDRLEISNPGGLPLGISKDNILHANNRRNLYLTRILHDLELMEGEGSGYNLIYEIASRDSKSFPIIFSDFNSTTVTQFSKILDQEALLLIDFIAKNYSLSQRDFIVLGIVARHKKILATQLTKNLQLLDEERLRPYTVRLLEQSILISRGKNKGTEYLINPKLIASSKINIKPTLKTIEIPRLKALIEEVLQLTPNISIAEIQIKIGDASIEDVRKATYSLVSDNILSHTGSKTFRKYSVAIKKRNEKENNIKQRQLP